jgi:hypothetical protein
MNLAVDTKPWYREPWQWILMAGPAIVVVGGIALLWVAATTTDGLVTEDYYKQGMAINATLAREQRAAALDLQAKLDITPDGAIRLLLTGDARPATLQLRLAHPTRAGLDRSVPLVRGDDGAYSGRTEPLPRSRWLVIVETDEWRLPTVETLGAAAGVHIIGGAR